MKIDQYVGDEMVVRWTVTAAREGPRPIACFFAIVAALEEAAPAFERDFGVVPTLRAALHAGPVISGEIGETKRRAARLEQATRDLHRPFLASADAVGRLASTDGYALDSLGPRPCAGAPPRWRSTRSGPCDSRCRVDPKDRAVRVAGGCV